MVNIASLSSSRTNCGKFSLSSGDVQGSITALQANIENGISVDSSRRALRVLLRSQAGYQSVFESLSLLPPKVTSCSFKTDQVTERCDQLHLLVEQPVCSKCDKENIATVIQDYEQGMCIPQPGNAVLYFAGKRRSEEVPLNTISIKDKIDEWTNHDGGRILVEKLQDPKFQFSATTTCLGVGPHRHHMVRPNLATTL